MNESLRRAGINLAVFGLVCVLGTFGLFAIFGQLRMRDGKIYKAEFSDVSGIGTGDFVRIAGVEVGQIKKVTITPAAYALVEFSVEPSVVLTEGTKAAIRWANPIGDRYLALVEGPGEQNRLSPGATIGLARTEPALDLDTLLGGFRPLFRALDPEQVNSLSAQLIQAFQDEGATIASFLSQAAAVTNTLADRDELIGQVIGNLDAVLGSFGDQNRQLAKAVTSLSELSRGLRDRKTDVVNAIAYTNAATATIADLLTQARPALKNTVTQTGRVSTIAADDRDYVDDLLKTLPHTYQMLSRLGIMGDFFTFYLCDLVLKVNGKGGQPVYVKLAGQDTGRCTPK